MKKIYFLFIGLFTVGFLSAQHATVYFSYENSTFNDNQPLPAEKNMMIRGNVGEHVTMVKVKLIDGRKGETKYAAHWKRPYNSNVTEFVIPFNRKLRSNTDVDLVFEYYRVVSANESDNASSQVFELLDAYVDQTYTTNGRKLRLTERNDRIIEDLNEIVQTSMSFYENRNEIKFSGFSDLVRLKLEQIENLKLKKAKFYVESTNDQNSASFTDKNTYREDVINELKDILHMEVSQVFNNEVFVVADTKYLYDYPVEKTKSTVAINAGYAGVFLGKTNGESLDIDQSPYVGISVPFANKSFSKKFWGNLTFDFGILVLNLEDDNGEKISGPIVKRPMYAGLGYKFLRFVKVQAGYTLLEYKGSGNQFVDADNIAGRPYVGIGVQFDLWMNFSK